MYDQQLADVIKYQDNWETMKRYLRSFMEFGDEESASTASAYYSLMQDIEEGKEPKVVDKTGE